MSLVTISNFPIFKQYENGQSLAHSSFFETPEVGIIGIIV